MASSSQPNGSKPSGGTKANNNERLDYGLDKLVNPLIRVAVEKLNETHPSQRLKVSITQGHFESEIPKWFKEQFPTLGRWKTKANNEVVLAITTTEYSTWVYFFAWVMNNWVFFPSGKEIMEYNSEDVGEFKGGKEARTFWLIEMATFLYLENIREYDGAICDELYRELNIFLRGSQQDDEEDDVSDGECHDTIGDALAYLVRGSTPIQPFFSVVVDVVAAHIVDYGDAAGKFVFVMNKYPEIAARVNDFLPLSETSETEGSDVEMAAAAPN